MRAVMRRAGSVRDDHEFDLCLLGAGGLAGWRQELQRPVHGGGERDPPVHPGQPQQLSGLRVLAHRAQAAAVLRGAARRADQRPERFGKGEKVDALVTSIDKATRKVSLSIKAREISEEKEAVEQYGSSDSGASLGDILGAALKKKPSKKKDEE